MWEGLSRLDVRVRIAGSAGWQRGARPDDFFLFSESGHGLI